MRRYNNAESSFLKDIYELKNPIYGHNFILESHKHQHLRDIKMIVCNVCLYKLSVRRYLYEFSEDSVFISDSEYNSIVEENIKSCEEIIMEKILK